MDTNTALFYVFSAVLLVAAFRVITARSPVYAALFLVLAFFSAACVWLLLRAEFLAIALFLVYVGAVMVLFLFVVMMLDVDVACAPASGAISRSLQSSASSSPSRWRPCCCPGFASPMRRRRRPRR
jgi:NADH:ubiquinone oxidoreductase subunit 6 (subunit J)